MPQPLSPKETSLFRTLVRNYEDKQYKKGLKAAEQILKKNPKHGDTMAMKALILNSMGKQEEAFILAKLALQNDMKSHVCWHVYGLLYRSDKNFEEAIKAYKFALRLDPESKQIQRDLALLQIQMRDYQGYITSRRAMLQASTHMRQNWTALAVAHHLAGNLEEAERVLTTYEETLKTPPPRTDFENSEAIMYKNAIIAEQGGIEKALQHLDSAGKQNLDRLAVMEYRADYLTRLGRSEEAVKVYRDLIERNPEHKAYYDGLVGVLKIGVCDHKALKAMYDEYADKFPRSDSPRRLPLDFLEGDDFLEAARTYICRMLDKGVPSTFANLKHLYPNAVKMEGLLSIVLDYMESRRVEVTDASMAKEGSSKGESAALYFLAQHYNYHLSRDLEKAMEFIEKAIKLEPNSADFRMTQARIWKHLGNLQKASETMDLARTFDTRDRYINTKAAKYQLRNDESKIAIETMGLFTRAETIGGPLADLHDMQCMWFLTEDGESYVRQGKIGLALKRFTSVYNIFDVWQEDQFDFHSFSLRKGQIRAYVDMMRWEDRLREHPFYIRAALSAIRLYLAMYDEPLAHHANGMTNGETDSEKKKAAKKVRKDGQRAERDAAVKQSAPNKVKDPETVKKVDDDPDGAQLATTKEPLIAAQKFLVPLLDMCARNVDAQLAGFDVYVRKGKYVLALKCLVAAYNLDRSLPAVHEAIIRFKLVIDAASSLDSHAKETIIAEFIIFPSSTSVSDFNETFLSQNKSSPLHIYAFLRIKVLLNTGDEASNVNAVLSTLDLPKVSLAEATQGLNLLASWKSNQLDAYKLKAARKWPEATIFKSQNRI